MVAKLPRVADQEESGANNHNRGKIDERFDDFAELEILLLPSNNTTCSRIHLLVNIFNEIFMVP